MTDSIEQRPSGLLVVTSEPPPIPDCPTAIDHGDDDGPWGGICWYCYWGWAKPVADLYDEAEADLGHSLLHFGPSHVVFEDENFDDDSVRFCLNECETNAAAYIDRDYPAADVAALAGYLRRLLEIPEDVRLCCPRGYDGEHPEDYPPAIEVVKR